MLALKLRMYLLVAVLFAIIYALITVIGVSLGVANFYFYLFVSLLMMFIQYMIGPKLVEWVMRVKYIDRSQNPQLHQMVEELAQRANLPKPKIGIAQLPIPNAFAFGRSIRDSRICVTEGITRLLNNEELRAVLGHEMSHIKNRDMLTITLLSVIPMILYRIAWSFMFYGGGRRRDSSAPSAALIGLIAFLFYFITNLLVLYASRIREYFADKGSVILGNPPHSLASALYKLVYGSARLDKNSLKETEGLKAFFVNDPSRAIIEIRELSQIDIDRSGTIDATELAAISTKSLKLNFADKMLELLSTHPNMLKRIRQLSAYKA